MITRAPKHGNGSSFHGAWLYYLHDKNALTSDRVAFTHTQNLPTDDPELAKKVMAFTAMNNWDIRVHSGNVEENSRKRKVGKPVYAYCLSWQEKDTPTKEHMIEAAQNSLKAIGLQDHEVIMVAHTDTTKPHIHMIVNTVNPHTGINNTIPHGKDRLSEWALEYERERGEIVCKQREENQKKREENRRRRDAGEIIYDRVKDRQSLNDAEYRRWKTEEMRHAIKTREQQVEKLSDRHRLQHLVILKATEEQIQKKRADLKERHRPFWAAMYKEQALQREQLEAAQATAWGRLRYYLSNQNRFSDTPTRLSVRQLLTQGFKATISKKLAFANLEQKHAERKQYLSNRINTAVRNDLKKINTAQDKKHDQLDIQQRKERAATKKAQSLESQQRAKDIASGKSREKFDKKTGHDKKIKADFDKSSKRDPELEKKKKREDTFRAFQELKEETTREKDTGREDTGEGDTGEGEDDFSVFSKDKEREDRGREREDRGRERDEDEEGDEDSSGPTPSNKPSGPPSKR